MWIEYKKDKPSITEKVLVLRQGHNNEGFAYQTIDMAYYCSDEKTMKIGFADFRLVQHYLSKWSDGLFRVEFDYHECAPEKAIFFKDVTHWCELPEIYNHHKIKNKSAL
jgi:hypothetical protein